MARQIPVSNLIGDILRNVDYTDFSEDDAIAWMGEALEIMRFPLSYKSTSECKTLKIDCGIVKLPCEITNIIDVKLKTPCCWVSIYSAPIGDEPYFIERGDELHFNIQYGEIQIDHYALDLSPDGVPMIEDKAELRRALAQYVQMKMDYKLMRKGTIPPDIYLMSQRDFYRFAMIAENRTIPINTTTLNTLLRSKSSFFNGGEIRGDNLIQ